MRSASAGCRCAYSSTAGIWPRRTRSENSSATWASSTESSDMVAPPRQSARIANPQSQQQAAQPLQRPHVALARRRLRDPQQAGHLAVAELLEVPPQDQVALVVVQLPQRLPQLLGRLRGG